VKMAEADAKGTRSYTPAASGQASRVSLALLSSIPATSSGLGAMATAVPVQAIGPRTRLLINYNYSIMIEILIR
jgi:hypothetical protein